MDRSADWMEERSVTSGYDIDRVSLFLFGVTAFLVVELFERDWNFLITCLNWTELPSRLDVDSWPMSHAQWLTLHLHWYNLAFRLNKDKYFLFDLRLRAVKEFYFRWLEISHYQNRNESSILYLDSVIFYYLKWNKPELKNLEAIG